MPCFEMWTKWEERLVILVFRGISFVFSTPQHPLSVMWESFNISTQRQKLLNYRSPVPVLHRERALSCHTCRAVMELTPFMATCATHQRVLPVISGALGVNAHVLMNVLTKKSNAFLNFNWQTQEHFHCRKARKRLKDIRHNFRVQAKTKGRGQNSTISPWCMRLIHSGQIRRWKEKIFRLETKKRNDQQSWPMDISKQETNQQSCSNISCRNNLQSSHIHSVMPRDVVCTSR